MSSIQVWECGAVLAHSALILSSQCTATDPETAFPLSVINTVHPKCEKSLSEDLQWCLLWVLQSHHQVCSLWACFYHGLRKWGVPFYNHHIASSTMSIFYSSRYLHGKTGSATSLVLISLFHMKRGQFKQSMPDLAEDGHIICSGTPPVRWVTWHGGRPLGKARQRRSAGHSRTHMESLFPPPHRVGLRKQKSSRIEKVFGSARAARCSVLNPWHLPGPLYFLQANGILQRSVRHNLPWETGED